ncbi:hypothetical protein COK91_28540 [Bacillus cereus]|nr:hypothetical protein COK91_28540 [Bacillus cereus]
MFVSFKCAEKSTKCQRKINKSASEQMKKALLWEKRSFTKNAYEENQFHQYSINKREFIPGAKY